MENTKTKLQNVERALLVFKKQEKELIELRDSLAIDHFKEITGLKIGQKLILQGMNIVVCGFENLTWPVAICTLDGQNCPIRLNDSDLKLMNIPTYTKEVVDIFVPKPDKEVILNIFRDKIKEGTEYKTDDQKVGMLLDIICTKF
jgi:hypothetical protein